MSDIDLSNVKLFLRHLSRAKTRVEEASTAKENLDRQLRVTQDFAKRGTKQYVLDSEFSKLQDSINKVLNKENFLIKKHANEDKTHDLLLHKIDLLQRAKEYDATVITELRNKLSELESSGGAYNELGNKIEKLNKKLDKSLLAEDIQSMLLELKLSLQTIDKEHFAYPAKLKQEMVNLERKLTKLHERGLPFNDVINEIGALKQKVDAIIVKGHEREKKIAEIENKVKSKAPIDSSGESVYHKKLADMEERINRMANDPNADLESVSRLREKLNMLKAKHSNEKPPVLSLPRAELDIPQFKSSQTEPFEIPDIHVPEPMQLPSISASKGFEFTTKPLPKLEDLPLPPPPKKEGFVARLFKKKS